MKGRYMIPAAIALAQLTGLSPHAGAQGGQPGQGAPASQTPPGTPGGGFIPGGPMMAGGPGGIDPMRANPMGLLQRSEVQNTLNLDLRQKNAIAELQEQSQAEVRQRIQQALQGNNPQQLRNLPPEERRARMQALQPQIQAAVQAWQGELNDKIRQILKPDQITRLYQLDKQRRGSLSMADPKVAAELKLTPSHRQAIQQIYQEYQQQVQAVVRAALESVQQTTDTRSGRRPPLPDFTNRLSPWKQKLDKVRKAAGEKVLATLDPDEKEAWKTATGEPFTFRADPPVQTGR